MSLAPHKPPQLIRALRIALRGKALLTSPRFNKGTAFPHRERIAFSLQGRLPYRPNTLDEQCDRAYQQLKRREWDRPGTGYKKRDEMSESEMEIADEETNLRKNTFLQSVKEQNWTLYYALLARHLKELVPVIYTPTQADAIQKYSHLFRRSEGLYLSYPEFDDMERTFLEKTHGRDIELIVVTDAEAILGIGDQGVGGIWISTAKSALYTLVGGIDPGKTLSIVLDVGTDNQQLLDDPLYIGWPERRVRGENYDFFVDRHVLFRFLLELGPDTQQICPTQRYRSTHAVFNDDIQGTGAVTLSFLLSAINVASQSLDPRLSKALHSSTSSSKHSAVDSKPLSSQRYVVLGFGAAGSGITRQLRDAMVGGEGVSREDAMKRFWIVDRNGLLYEDESDEGGKERVGEGMERKREWARGVDEGWGREAPVLPKVSVGKGVEIDINNGDEEGVKATGVDADDGIEYEGKMGIGKGLDGKPDLSVEWEGIDPFIEVEKPGDLLREWKGRRKPSGRDESQRMSQVRKGTMEQEQGDSKDMSASTRKKRKVSLLEVIQRVRPTVLIGCSTSAGAFNEEVVRAMVDGLHYEASEALDESTRDELAKQSETGRVEGPMPIILCLSNPKRLSEAKPKDLLRWTDGRALVATGSPFGSVNMKVGGVDREFKIAECNNALIYPGLGFGTILAQSRSVTDTMILAGARRLAELGEAMKAIESFSSSSQSTSTKAFEYKGQALLPDFADAPKVNFEVAAAVCEQAIREDTAGRMWYTAKGGVGSLGSHMGASYSESVPTAKAGREWSRELPRLSRQDVAGMVSGKKERMEGYEEGDERVATGPPGSVGGEGGGRQLDIGAISEIRKMAIQDVRDEASRRVWVPVYCDYVYDENGLVE
ncbi:hypothetical protein CVT24_002658 [Panaeolus cyanescens]|uniref:Malic enzyme n=1 Tax=Panaeolus cyanescens TaxID=181874 RepID=A0A409WB77_9AGAR|nr:hypothetical protein CVT24_002658 [Panaeolus cyanescens]